MSRASPSFIPPYCPPSEWSEARTASGSSGRASEAGATAAFQRARAIAPGFGAPQERLGTLAEAAGRSAEAVHYYEEAALQNGAFALPIARLATMARRDGRLDKAVALLERNAQPLISVGQR